MSELDQTDLAFIRETYPAYTKKEVCTKLSITFRQYDAALADLGLSEKGVNSLHCPRLDWPNLWYAYVMRGSIKEAASAIGAEYNAARYAIHRMRGMSDEQRQGNWNRYAHVHGRDEYTNDDLAVIVWPNT